MFSATGYVPRGRDSRGVLYHVEEILRFMGNSFSAVAHEAVAFSLEGLPEGEVHQMIAERAAQGTADDATNWQEGVRGVARYVLGKYAYTIHPRF